MGTCNYLTVERDEALVIAADLLNLYEIRMADRRRQIAMSGEKAFEESMTALGARIVKFHPELRVNLDQRHRPAA